MIDSSHAMATLPQFPCVIRPKPTGHMISAFRRVVLGITAIGSGQILNATSNVILIPLFLRSWPVAVYGEWLTLSAITAYAAIADLGMNSAAVNSITDAYAKGDLPRFRMLQASALLWYIILAGAITFAAALLCFLVPIHSVLAIHHIPVANVKWTVWMLAARVGWQLPLNQLRTTYRNTGKVAASEWILNGQSLISFVFTGVGLLYGVNTVGIALLNLATVGIAATIVLWLLSRSPNQLMPQMRRASRNGIRELRKPTAAFGGVMLASLIVQQGPIIIITRMLGSGYSVVFNTARTLSNLLRQATMTVGFALWPEITRLNAIRAFTLLKTYHRIYGRISIALSCVCGATLWFQGESILRTWTQNRLTVDHDVLHGLIILCVAQGAWGASALLVTATNLPSVLAISTIASSIIGIALSASLLRHFGIVALPLGLLVGDLLACVYPVTRKACRLLDEDYSEYSKDALRTLALFATSSYAIAQMMSSILSRQSLFVRVAGVSLTTLLIAMALAWFISLTKNDRAFANQYIGKALHSYLGIRLRDTSGGCEA